MHPLLRDDCLLVDHDSQLVHPVQRDSHSRLAHRRSRRVVDSRLVLSHRYPVVPPHSLPVAVDSLSDDDHCQPESQSVAHSLPLHS